MASINVRSILPKIDEIRLLLSSTSLDILSVCETWLDNSVTDNEISVSGYSVVRKDRNRHGGGVLVFVKDGIKFELLSYASLDNVEAVFLKIIGVCQLVVGSLYRPPSAPSSYFDAIFDCIEEISVNHEEVILMGDLNIDCSARSARSPVSYMEVAFELHQIVTSKTRVTDSSSTLIDVILTRKPEKHTLTDVLETTFSDHFMTFTVYVANERARQKHKVMTFKDYKYFNADAFLNDLSCSSIFGIVTDDLDYLWATFKQEFIRICEKYAPTKQRRLKKRYNPWISPEIVQSMYARDHEHKLARRTGDDNHWNTYRRLRNSVTTMIKSAKRRYFENEFCQSTNQNPKRMWKVIDRLTREV